MLVGRKNCRKIVQFLVEPLMKKQSISPRVSGFFVSNSDRLKYKETSRASFCVSNPLASDELELQTVFRYDSSERMTKYVWLS